MQVEDVALIEGFANRLVQSRVVRGALTLANRVPVPYERLPVTLYGTRMTARTLDRHLALWLWKFRLLGRAEADLLPRLCRQGMSVVDVGANVGLFTMILGRAVGRGGHVHAFEPDPANHGDLCRNLERNGCANVTAVRAAVGRASGPGTLYRSPFGCDHQTYPGEPGRASIPVPMIALDDYFPPERRIDLIKMDIQGGEGAAIQGMSRILSSNPGIRVLMEFWPDGLRRSGCAPEAVLKDLETLGFSVERLDEGTGSGEPVGSPTRFVESLKGNRYANILATSKGG